MWQAGVVIGDSCVVWWARISEHRPALDRFLSEVEVARAQRLRRPEDRVRQTLGAVLLRLAVSAETGTPPIAVTVDRTCPRCPEPHWRPGLPGTGLHASITHSGDLVGLALTRVAPVGLDVERISEVDITGLSGTVLHEEERAVPVDGPGFFTYWTRKEAVVKATGDGIGAQLARVRVSVPSGPAALLAYPGHDHLPAHLADLHPAPGYKAALAVLTAEPVRVEEREAEPLLQAV